MSFLVRSTAHLEILCTDRGSHFEPPCTKWRGPKKQIRIKIRRGRWKDVDGMQISREVIQ